MILLRLLYSIGRRCIREEVFSRGVEGKESV